MRLLVSLAVLTSLAVIQSQLAAASDNSPPPGACSPSNVVCFTGKTTWHDYGNHTVFKPRMPVTAKRKHKGACISFRLGSTHQRKCGGKRKAGKYVVPMKVSLRNGQITATFYRVTYSFGSTKLYGKCEVSNSGEIEGVCYPTGGGSSTHSP